MSKKTFKNNPALQFISEPEESEQTDQEIKAPVIQPKIEQKTIEDTPAPATVPMKLNPLYIETRSRRLQLLLQPSLHEKLKAMAAAKGISINELIHSALDEYANREQP